MIIDIEKAVHIYFDNFLIRLLDNYFYFQMSDEIRGQLIVEAISSFQKEYTQKKFPYGHNLRKSNDDVIDFDIHFNYKGKIYHIHITLYPKLVQRRLKLNKILNK